MTPEFARSIGDGYPDYVDDELGYTYHAWEVISASESRRHEQILHASPKELSALKEELSPLTDLDRWAIARRVLSGGDHGAYFELLEPVINGDFDHPALHYPEILSDVARRRAESDDLAAGQELITRLEEVWPQFEEVIPLLRAKLLLVAGQPDEAHDGYTEALDGEERVDLLVETAEDFAQYDAYEIAHRWLNRARRVAEEIGDKASAVDIALLADSLPEIDELPPSDDAGDDE